MYVSSTTVSSRAQQLPSGAVRRLRSTTEDQFLPLVQARLCSDVDVREGMEEPENVQEPQNHANHHHRIQNRLDRSLHRYVPIDQPKQNAYNNQNHHDLK
jgi:hypothetical protein